MRSSAQLPQPDMAKVLADLTAWPERIKSIDVVFEDTDYFTEDFYHLMNVSRGSFANPQMSRVEWAIKGSHSYRNTTLLDENGLSGKNSLTDTSIFDGSVKHDLQSGVGSYGRPINSGYVQRTKHINYLSPLVFGLQVGGRWIIDVLKSGSYTLEGVTQDPKFGPLYIVRWQNQKGAKTRFWFAPNYDSLAVRIETESSDGKINAQYLCSDVVSKDGFYFPLNGTKEWRCVQDGRSILLSKEGMKTISVDVNKVADTLFDTNLPAGATLFNKDTQEGYRIGADGTKTVDERTAQQWTSFPLQWLFILSCTSLILIGVTGFLKWRRPSKQV